MRTLGTGRSSAAPQVELCAAIKMNNHPAAIRYEDVLTELCYDMTVPWAAALIINTCCLLPHLEL